MDKEKLKNSYADDECEVWKLVYKEAYKDKIIGEKYDIENPEAMNKWGRYMVYQKNKSEIAISGETDFNFSNKPGLHRQSKYEIYKKILSKIKDEERRKKCIELLDDCCKMTYTIYNFSLMQVTGSLQIINIH